MTIVISWHGGLVSPARQHPNQLVSKDNIQINWPIVIRHGVLSQL